MRKPLPKHGLCGTRHAGGRALARAGGRAGGNWRAGLKKIGAIECEGFRVINIYFNN